MEIFNGDSHVVNLTGSRLENQSGQTFSLYGSVPAQGYAVFRRPEMKLTLRNTDGKLLLYDSGGNLIHESAFYGTAPEGKSYGFHGGRFFFSDPTPGGLNALPNVSELSLTDYPAGALIHSVFPGAGIFGLALGVGIVFAALAVYVIKKNNDLHELFFGRHEEIR